MKTPASKPGTPAQVIRRRKLSLVVPEQEPSKFARLKKRKSLVGDPESIVHMDWLKGWRELK
jgi:hypothetical protein